ncbi:hypothetical protein TURU_068547 [Turdus rufiventris]|nr:hypothetical protein TURU_068547 [Turdus rufiventris]
MAAGRGKPGTSVAAGQGEVEGNSVAVGKCQEELRESAEKRRESAVEKRLKSGKKSQQKVAKMAAKKRRKIAVKSGQKT